MGKYLFCLLAAVVGGAVAVFGIFMLLFGTVMQALLLIIGGVLTLWFGWSGMRELRPKQKKPAAKRIVITCIAGGFAVLCLATGLVFTNAYLSVKTLRAELYDYSHQALDRWVMNDIPYFEEKIDTCNAVETLFLSDVIDDFEQWKADSEAYVIDYAEKISDEIDLLEPITDLTSETQRGDIEVTIFHLKPDTNNYFGKRLMVHLRNYDKLKAYIDAYEEALARCSSPCDACESGRIGCTNCGESGKLAGTLCPHCDGIGSVDCVNCNGGTLYTYGK